MPALFAYLPYPLTGDVRVWGARFEGTNFAVCRISVSSSAELAFTSSRFAFFSNGTGGLAIAAAPAPLSPCTESFAFPAPMPAPLRSPIVVDTFTSASPSIFVTPEGMVMQAPLWANMSAPLNLGPGILRLAAGRHLLYEGPGAEVTTVFDLFARFDAPVGTWVPAAEASTARATEITLAGVSMACDSMGCPFLDMGRIEPPRAIASVLMWEYPGPWNAEMPRQVQLFVWPRTGRVVVNLPTTMYLCEGLREFNLSTSSVQLQVSPFRIVHTPSFYAGATSTNASVSGGWLLVANKRAPHDQDLAVFDLCTMKELQVRVSRGDACVCMWPCTCTE